MKVCNCNAQAKPITHTKFHLKQTTFLLNSLTIHKLVNYYDNYNMKVCNCNAQAKPITHTKFHLKQTTFLINSLTIHELVNYYDNYNEGL